VGYGVWDSGVLRQIQCIWDLGWGRGSAFETQVPPRVAKSNLFPDEPSPTSWRPCKYPPEAVCQSHVLIKSLPPCTTNSPGKGVTTSVLRSVPSGRICNPAYGSHTGLASSQSLLRCVRLSSPSSSFLFHSPLSLVFRETAHRHMPRLPHHEFPINTRSCTLGIAQGLPSAPRHAHRTRKPPT